MSDEDECLEDHDATGNPCPKRARLDADRTARPLTEIAEVFDEGDGKLRTLFEGAGKEYIVRSTEESSKKLPGSAAVRFFQAFNEYAATLKTSTRPDAEVQASLEAWIRGYSIGHSQSDEAWRVQLAELRAWMQGELAKIRGAA